MSRKNKQKGQCGNGADTANPPKNNPCGEFYYRRTIGLPLLQLKTPEETLREDALRYTRRGNWDLKELGRRMAERKTQANQEARQEKPTPKRLTPGYLLALGKRLADNAQKNEKLSAMSFNWEELRVVLDEFDSVDEKILLAAFCGLPLIQREIIFKDYGLGDYSNLEITYTNEELSQAVARMRVYIKAINVFLRKNNLTADALFQVSLGHEEQAANFILVGKSYDSAPFILVGKPYAPLAINPITARREVTFPAVIYATAKDQPAKEKKRYSSPVLPLSKQKGTLGEAWKNVQEYLGWQKPKMADLAHAIWSEKLLWDLGDIACLLRSPEDLTFALYPLRKTFRIGKHLELLYSEGLCGIEASYQLNVKRGSVGESKHRSLGAIRDFLELNIKAYILDDEYQRALDTFRFPSSERIAIAEKCWTSNLFLSLANRLGDKIVLIRQPEQIANGFRFLHPHELEVFRLSYEEEFFEPQEIARRKGVKDQRIRDVKNHGLDKLVEFIEEYVLSARISKVQYENDLQVRSVTFSRHGIWPEAEQWFEKLSVQEFYDLCEIQEIIREGVSPEKLRERLGSAYSFFKSAEEFAPLLLQIKGYKLPTIDQARCFLAFISKWEISPKVIGERWQRDEKVAQHLADYARDRILIAIHRLPEIISAYQNKWPPDLLRTLGLRIAPTESVEVVASILLAEHNEVISRLYGLGNFKKRQTWNMVFKETGIKLHRILKVREESFQRMRDFLIPLNGWEAEFAASLGFQSVTLGSWKMALDSLSNFERDTLVQCAKRKKTFSQISQKRGGTPSGIRAAFIRAKEKMLAVFQKVGYTLTL